MKNKLFVSYRRADDPAMAARIKQALGQKFGDENVFLDVENLLLGERFDAQLERNMSESAIVIVVIGLRWHELLAINMSGTNRDYVVAEIEWAIKNGLSIIPLLVGLESALPKLVGDTELPASIVEFSKYQTFSVTHEHFHRDIEALASNIIQANRGKFKYIAWRYSLYRHKFIAGGLAASVLFSLGLFYITAPKPDSPLQATGRNTFQVILANRSADKVLVYNAKYGDCSFLPWATEFEVGRSFHAFFPKGKEGEWEERPKKRIDHMEIAPVGQLKIEHRNNGYGPAPCGFSNVIEVGTSKGTFTLIIPREELRVDDPAPPRGGHP